MIGEGREFKADSEIKSLDDWDNVIAISFANIMKMKQVIRKKYNYGLGHIEYEFYVAGRTASWKCQLEIV